MAKELSYWELKIQAMVAEDYWRRAQELHGERLVGPEWGPNPHCPGDEHTDDCPAGCIPETDGYSWDKKG